MLTPHNLEVAGSVCEFVELCLTKAEKSNRNLVDTIIHLVEDIRSTNPSHPLTLNG